MCQFGLLKLVDAITLLAASGDDLVDAEDAVVEEVRDPPLLIPAISTIRKFITYSGGIR